MQDLKDWRLTAERKAAANKFLSLDIQDTKEQTNWKFSADDWQ